MNQIFKSTTSLFQLLVCLLLLTSCTSIDENSPIKIEDGYVNKQILLTAPDFLNTFNTKDSIYLEIKYITDNEIIFPNNYNLRMFLKNEANWMEINEIPTERMPAGDVVLSPNYEMPAILALFVAPDLQYLSQSNELRIYIMGNMKINTEIKQVFAYVDVVLHP